MTYIDRYPDNIVLNTLLVPIENGFCVKWNVKNIGVGEFNIFVKEDGTIKIWNECMGPKFIKHILGHMVDNAELME